MNPLSWLKNTVIPAAEPTVRPLASDARRPDCVHEYINERAEESPHEIAVVSENRELTYSELNRRANKLAHFLRKRGAGAETLVGLGLTRSENLFVGLLGIWKAGAGYVPLETRFPRERLKYTITDSQPVCIVTEESVRNLWDGFDAELVFIDSDLPEISRESDRAPASVTDGDNIAQLLYTSGSTGRPKGVEILHRGLVNFMHWTKVEPGITERDTVVAATVMTSDTSGVELFIPLTLGAKIILVGNEGIGTRSFFALLEKHNATVIQGTPTALQWFDEFGWEGKKDLKIISGGEALSRDVAEKLIPRCGELWNIYGPTETTIWSTLTRVDSGPGPVPIGHPICNTQIHILDEHLQPVPHGEAGEICIGGSGVARGYRNRPEETAARFVANPAGSGAGDRIYRTGDLGRLAPSGDYEYLGRMDHQIKINGERIEPEEIEFAMKQFPGVQRSLVIAREDVPGEKHLVGYFTIAEGHTVETQELRRFLLGQLPPKLVPPQVVVLPAFPQLINGKIDRNALPKPGLPLGKTAAP